PRPMPPSTRFVIGADRALDGKPQCANLGAQAAARDAEDAGGLKLVAPGVIEQACEEMFFELLERLGIKVFRAGFQPGRDEAVPVRGVEWDRGGLGFGGA